MRRLLVLLSVVLLFALCQSQLIKKDKIKKPIKIRDCLFGFKKVNGTKECKTKEEFFKHPRNDTNCTKKNKTLKCFKFQNATACLCVRKPIPKNPIKFKDECPAGRIKRCKVDRFTGQQKCRCLRIGPVKDDTVKGEIECKEGEKKVCKSNGVCICRKLRDRRPPIDPNAVGLF